MRPLPFLFTAMLLLSGCATTEIDTSESRASGEFLPRPDRLVVYDINATPADVPPTSAFTGRYQTSPTPPSPEEIRQGRELGRQVAERLVDRLRKMGMTADRARSGPPPRIGDVVLAGQFVTIDEGSRDLRLTIGFGKGSSQLTTHIEGYLVTADGLRLLGSRQLTDRGGKKPGMLVPVAASAASRSPVGLIVGSTINVEKELNSETIPAAAKRTADAIAVELEEVFRAQGWI